MKNRIIKIIAVIVGVALGVGAWWYSNRMPEPAGDASGKFTGKNTADQWLQAVASNDDAKMRTLARQILQGKDTAQVVDPWYETLFKKKNVQTRYLTDPFIPWDAKMWRHALFFKTEAQKIVKQSSEPEIPALFKAVRDRIEPVERADDQPEWPYRVWQRKFGVCDRQAWVLCELAYQLGYETMIIWLINPKTGESPHTICEIRSPNGKTWLADPFSGVLEENTSLRDLAKNPHQCRKIWPKHPEWADFLSSAYIMVTAHPSDYCLRNQMLAEKLQDLLGADAPRFGDDPKTRKKRFVSLADKSSGKSLEDDFSVGFYGHPFVLLHKEFRRMKK